jgi:hypothetical protein
MGVADERPFPLVRQASQIPRFEGGLGIEILSAEYHLGHAHVFICIVGGSDRRPHHELISRAEESFG